MRSALRRLARVVVACVPYGALAVLAAVIALALLSEPPPVLVFREAPEVAPLPQPDLGLGPASLQGEVVDNTGRPIADAGLVAVLDARLAWTWSDREGRFTLEDLPDRTLELAVVARGFEPARPTATPGPGLARIVLTRRIDPAPEVPALGTTPVSGRVTFTPLERPDEGYELAFLPALGLQRVDAGLPVRVPVAADGTYFVPGLVPGEYEVHLLPPEARGGTWPNLLEGADGEPPRHVQPGPGGAATEGERDPVRLDLRSRAGGVGGTLSARRKSGASVWLTGALVRAEPVDETGRPAGARVTWTLSDADGNYRLRHLPPGRYRVTLAAGAERRERAVLVGERTLVDPNL